MPYALRYRHFAMSPAAFATLEKNWMSACSDFVKASAAGARADHDADRFDGIALLRLRERWDETRCEERNDYEPCRSAHAKSL